VKALLVRIKDQLGPLGLCALGALCACAVFVLFVVQPLEQRSAQLEDQLSGKARLLKTVGQPARLGSFYGFFDRDERLEDWLAKLYATATAAGLEFRNAEYRLVESRQRLQRYQITLPMSGSYVQVRTFLEAALIEIPVMSIDQVTFRRKQVGDTRVEVEAVMSLHLLRL
jgi:hypothetical protein